MNFVDELKWRGMVQDMTPGLEEQLKKELTTAYVGIDPTADSLHIGHLVGVMILKHFQESGHRPIALIGGATGMIGDPSGKSEERNMLDEETLAKNQAGIKAQLEKLLDFDAKEKNAAQLVNNYDWLKKISFLDFISNVGKLLTVNYMMAKDSVKKRFDGDGDGMSFTEFSYQLVQGYDYIHLYENLNCKVQLGGSDQWGNITTGIEMIRRQLGEEAFGLTCPLIKKADGAKFGKTESGNIWLDPRYTSPYEFYQFWLNTSDKDAETYIKIFTLLDKETIAKLVKEHAEAPHQRALQRALAKEVTCMVHSEEEYNKAVEASEILFGQATTEALRKIDEATLLQVMKGVPQFEVSKAAIDKGIGFIDLVTENATVFPSKGETRKLIQGGGVSLNKERVENVEHVVTSEDLIADKYLLVQRGRRNYFLLIAQ